jgi:hypothetical protein
MVWEQVLAKLYTSMALERSEGEKLDMKIRNEYFENSTEFHIFGEDTEKKSKFNARRNCDHMKFLEFLSTTWSSIYFLSFCNIKI